MIYKDTEIGFISFREKASGWFLVCLLGFFYCVWVGFFFFLALGKIRQGFACHELGELSCFLGGISALGRGKA